MAKDLRNRLETWEKMPYPNAEYPPGSEEAKFAGEDLALLAGNVAAVLDLAIRGGRLDNDDHHLLHSSIAALERVLPYLTGRRVVPKAVISFPRADPLMIVKCTRTKPLGVEIDRLKAAV